MTGLIYIKIIDLTYSLGVLGRFRGETCKYMYCLPTSEPFVLILNALLAQLPVIPLFVPSALPDEFVPKRIVPNAQENMSLVDGGQHLFWRKSRNATEPAEILAIKSE